MICLHGSIRKVLSLSFVVFTTLERSFANRRVHEITERPYKSVRSDPTSEKVSQASCAYSQTNTPSTTSSRVYSIDITCQSFAPKDNSSGNVDGQVCGQASESAKTFTVQWLHEDRHSVSGGTTPSKAEECCSSIMIQAYILTCHAPPPSNKLDLSSLSTLLSSAGRAQDCNCSTSNRYLEARGSIPRGETFLLSI